jgi:hypothetical protein
MHALLDHEDLAEARELVQDSAGEVKIVREPGSRAM